METLTKLTRAAELAAQILNISRNTLVVNMRYLDAALFRRKPQPAALQLATDGEKLYYDPLCILNGYKAEKVQCVDMFGHSVHVETCVKIVRIE